MIKAILEKTFDEPVRIIAAILLSTSNLLRVDFSCNFYIFEYLKEFYII